MHKSKHKFNAIKCFGMPIPSVSPTLDSVALCYRREDILLLTVCMLG
jgi:hypothetical protein